MLAPATSMVSNHDVVNLFVICETINGLLCLSSAAGQLGEHCAQQGFLSGQFICALLSCDSIS